MKQEVSNKEQDIEKQVEFGGKYRETGNDLDFEFEDLIEELFSQEFVEEEDREEKYVGNLQRKSFKEKEKPWRTIVHIDARIVEVNKKDIHLDCLLDPEKNIVEERVFDRSLFEGHIPVEIGQLVILILMERPGEQRIVVKNGKGIVDEEPFEVEGGVGDIAKTVFSKPSPID